MSGMGNKRWLNTLADEIGSELRLQDDLIIREVRTADSLADAKNRLLDIRRDVAAALRIVNDAERRFRH